MEVESFGVDWAALADDPYTAREIPLNLRSLHVAANERAAIDSACSLHELICYASVTVEETTVPAVRIMFTMLTDVEFKWKQFALQLIDSVACVPGVLDVSLPDSSLKNRVRDEILRGMPLVEEAERSEVRDVRGAAIELLGDAALDLSRKFDHFVEEFEREKDVILQADLAYAATAVYIRGRSLIDGKRGRAWLDYVLDHPNPAVRYRVARRLIESEFQSLDVSLDEIVKRAEPKIRTGRLFRTEYI